MMATLRGILMFLIICHTKLVLCKIQCLDENNQPVDWYVVYKLPKLDDSLSKGEEYMYITSETLNEGWTWSTLGIQENNTLLANTLRPHYTINEGLWILYNDKNPKWGDISYLFLHGGHTKGVVGADAESGIWLVHSVPKFPPTSDKGYGYPETGLTNGQSALCMSLTAASLNTVGQALVYNDPNIYEERVDPGLINIYPALDAAMKKTYSAQIPWYIKREIKTVGGTTFVTFAKAKKFKQDLYDLVASELKSDLLVETWQNAIFPMRSSCSGSYRVMNIKGIGLSGNNVTYSSSKDHSKWATGDQNPWTCIGDINRTKHQKKRGGGTVCLNNKKLWSQYRQTINKIQSC